MLKRLAPIVVLALTLVACGTQPSATAPTPAATPATATEAPTTVEDSPTTEAAATAPADQELRQVTLAMSYIPNVQFAPYYVAAAKGYYKEAGIEVSFDYNFENDVVQRAAAWPDSKVEFATASGTSTLLARQQGLPVKTVMTLYQKFPVVFFAKSSTGLKSVDDLKGKTVGLPGRFGENFYALLAVLYANNLDESAMNVQEIGFTQTQAVLEDKVQVAIGYAMNEPLIMEQQGAQVDVLRVADIYDLASNGIVISEALIAQDPALVRSFIKASLRGLQDTLDNPEEAYTLSMSFIPEAQLGDPSIQRKVLEASLPYWSTEKTDSEGLGITDVAIWVKTEQFMRDASLLTEPVDVNVAFTNDFIK